MFLRKLSLLVIPNQLYFPSQDVDEASLLLKIASNISIKKFNKFLEYKAPRGYKYQHDNNSNVFIIDMSNEEHGRLTVYLSSCFNTHNGGILTSNRPIIIATNTFHPSSDERKEKRKKKEKRRKIAPDLTIVPNVFYVSRPNVAHPGSPPSNSNGNSYARIVVELGNHQSTSTWIAKCQLWLQEVYVHYVFGIKLHKPSDITDNQGRKYKAMIARLWTQGSGYQEWDFGSIPTGANIQQNQPISSTGCTGPGLTNFLVSIPVSEIFFDPPIPSPIDYIPGIPAGVTIDSDANFTIDLYYVQQEVLMSQKN